MTETKSCPTDMIEPLPADADIATINRHFWKWTTDADLWIAFNTVDIEDDDTRRGMILLALVGDRLGPVDGLDSKILAKIKENGRGSFDMDIWHRNSNESMCGTSHCRAGWAEVVHPNTDFALKLGGEIGHNAVGAAIYLASTGNVPSFYCGNTAAMLSMKAAAEKETA
jgi:hypothetical protein